MSDTPGIARLRSLLDHCESKNQGACEAIGLLLHKRLGPSGYDQTPPGLLTFASTGGDGVHFSLAGASDTAPVVMTVPMNPQRPNLVVGGSLQQFLGLGIPLGFFVLEGLSYSPGSTASQLDKARLRDLPAAAAKTLRALSKSMGARRWRDHAATLAVLQSEHADLIDQPH